MPTVVVEERKVADELSNHAAIFLWQRKSHQKQHGNEVVSHEA